MQRDAGRAGPVCMLPSLAAYAQTGSGGRSRLSVLCKCLDIAQQRLQPPAAALGLASETVTDQMLLGSPV